MTLQVLPLSAPLAAHPQAQAFEDCGLNDLPEEPLYGQLCRLIARSLDLLGLMDAAPATQRRANLILAALHSQVLRGGPVGPAGPGQATLPEWYGSVGGGRVADDPGLPDALARFASQHAAALQQDIRLRRTQTNEIGRCTALRPALDAIARQPGRQRLALFDFGCSAGLNLLVDHYRIHYRIDGRSHPPGHHQGMTPTGPSTVGPDDAPSGTTPLLHCDWYGAPPPGGWPDPPAWSLVARCGCDQAPVPLDDTEAVRWLQACLWPGDAPRQARLTAALALAQRLRPPVVAAEDGLAVLAQWLQQLPADVTPVLFNSWVLAYFTPAMLDNHQHRVHELLRGRGLLWLSAEDAAITRRLTGLALPDSTVPGEARAETASHTFWTLSQAGPDGQLQHRLLARSHPHGRWAQWLDAG